MIAKYWKLLALAGVASVALSAGANAAAAPKWRINPYTGHIDLYISSHTDLTSTGTLTHDQLESKLGGVTADTTSINNHLLNGALTIYDEGAPIGNATTLNCAGANVTCTQSGSTTTLTVTGSAGGGGGGGGAWIATTAFQFNQAVTTIVFVGQFVDSAAYVAGLATITISGAPFWAYSSTADTRMNGFSTQNSTTDTRLNAIAQSTTDIQNFYSGQNSTADVVIAALLGDTNAISADIVNLTYYLHSETTGTNSAFQLLLSSPSNLAEITKTQNVTLAGGLVKISSHVTRDIEPQVRKLPAGLWTSVTWAAVSALGGSTQLVVTISTASFDLTTITEILSATSPAITATSPERFDLVSVQTNDITVSTSDRILVQYFARTTLGLGTNVSIYYAGTSRPSHLDTPVGSVYKFVQLADTPQTLIGSQGKYLSVNSDQTTTVFISSITDSFNAYTATADSRMTTIGLNSGTVAGNLYAYESTADAKANAIGISTTNLHSFDDTPILGYNGGSPIGTMTVISAGTNITLSMVGTTMTIAAASGGGGGDSFGSHRASQTVDMSSYNIVAVGTISVTGDVVSTNTVRAGTMTAVVGSFSSSFTANLFSLGSGTVVGQVSTSSGLLANSSILPPGGTTFIVTTPSGSFVINERGNIRIVMTPQSGSLFTIRTATADMVLGFSTYEYNTFDVFTYLDPLNGIVNGNVGGIKSTIYKAPHGRSNSASPDLLIPIISSMTWNPTSGSVTLSAYRGIDSSSLIDGPAGTVSGGLDGARATIRLAGTGDHSTPTGLRSIISADNVLGSWFSAYGLYIDVGAGAAFNTSGAGTGKTYGIFLNQVEGNKNNNWGVYVNPAVKNYFAGPVGVGTNTPIGVGLEVAGSSIASTGAGSGLVLSSALMPVAIPYFRSSFSSTTIHGGVDIDSVTILSTMTVNGPIVSKGQFVLNGGTFTSAIVFPDGSIQKTAASAPGAGSADNMGTHVATKPIDVTNFGIVNIGSMSNITSANGQTFVSSYPYVDWPISVTRLHGVNISTDSSGGSDGLAISSKSANAFFNFDYFPLQNGSTHMAYFQTKFPDSWDGSTIAFNLDWYASSATANGTLNAVFALQAVAISSGSSINAVYGTSVSVITTLVAANQIARTPTSASITVGGNPTKNCMVYFRLLRMGLDGRDTVTAFANVVGLNLRFREISNSDEERSP